jgi:hypothetical protein
VAKNKRPIKGFHCPFGLAKTVSTQAKKGKDGNVEIVKGIIFNSIRKHRNEKQRKLVIKCIQIA